MTKVVVSRSRHIIFKPRNLKSERTAGYFLCHGKVNTGTAMSDIAKRTADGRDL